MNYYASISGGKDSAAMYLHLREQGIEAQKVFFDTGWEHPATYHYLSGPLAEAIGKIITVQPRIPDLEAEPLRLALELEAMLGREIPSAMIRWTVKKAMFPSKTRRWCTDTLKIKAARDFYRERMAQGETPINCIGIRAGESKARAKLPERELSTSIGVMVWRPIHHFTEADVIAIHSKHNLAPNPLYLAGSQRVGCWPCIYSRKAEIRLIAEQDQPRIKMLQRFEAVIQQLNEQRCKLKGEETRHKPTFFMDKTGDMYPSIDEVVSWSKTSHGGKQFSMFRDDEVGSPPCMRWGLCDLPPELDS